MNCNTRFPDKFLILICFLGFFMSDLAQAAKVSQVRGKNILIELEGTGAKPGDIFFVVNPQGQHQGVVRIGQVRGRQAIAQLGRGQAQHGWSLVPRNQSAERPGSPKSASTSTAQKITQGQPSQAAQPPKTTLPYIHSQEDRAVNGITMRRTDVHLSQMNRLAHLRDYLGEHTSILDFLYERSWSWVSKADITKEDRELFEIQVLRTARENIEFSTPLYVFPQIKFILANPHFPQDLRSSYEATLRRGAPQFTKTDARIIALITELTGKQVPSF